MPFAELPADLGRYRVLKLLGTGAMGSVYLADDTQLSRQVALKLPKFDARNDPEGLARFHREARLAAGLRHPNICPVFDVGEIDGQHYIAMAYIDGQPLTQLVKAKSPPSERSVLILIRKLALALQAAHTQGIVHRDLKPANVMLDSQREPIIMDFGLACGTRPDDVRLTQSGVVLGSPAYMSPEQLEGDARKITGAADQYSLGVVMFELLTGQLPYQGSLTAVINQIVSQPVPAVSSLRPHVDPRVDALCQRMMSKSAAERFPTMKAVADEITRLLAKPTATADSGSPATPTATSAREKKGVETVVSDRERWEAEIPQQFALANDLYRKHDYAEVCKVLGRIPAGVRPRNVEQLLADAAEKDDECCLLLSDIEEALKQQTPTDLQPMLKRFLKLKPGHKGMQQLARDLERYGVEQALRIRRKQGEFTDPAGRTIDTKTVVLVAGGLVALCASVYFAARAYEAPRGKVIVNVADPAIEVTFDRAKVTTAQSGQEFRLPPDEPRTLLVSVHGVSWNEATRTIAVKKNETKTITARLLPDRSLEVDIAETGQRFTTAPVAEPAIAQAPIENSDATPWSYLFDGATREGWEGASAWQVHAGTLQIVPERITDQTSLQTTATFSDFELRFQFRVLNEGSLSLMLRHSRDSEGGNLGPQLNLGFSKGPGDKLANVTGNLFALLNHRLTDLDDATDQQRPPLEAAVRKGEWINVFVRCEGPQVSAVVNGFPTVNYVDTQRELPLSGHIGFYTPESQPVQAEIRNLQQRLIGPAATALLAHTPVSAPSPAANSMTTPVASAPMPAAGTRKILFADDYDLPQSYWSNTTPEQLRENPHHEWGFRDGVFFDAVRAPSWYSGMVPGGPYPECTLETSGRVVGDNPSSRGAVMLHLFQDQRGIQIVLDGTGRLYIAPSATQVEKFNRGPWIGPITHSAIRPGGSGYNKVRLDIRRRQLAIYINDVAVINPLEFAWDLTPVTFGLGVSCLSPSVKAEYDRVEIGELREPIPTADGRPPEPIRILANGAAVLPNGTHCYEGMTLPVAGITGGEVISQTDLSSFGGVWTNDCQLLWASGKAGSTLTLDVPIEAEGLYQLVPGFTLGPDFGRFKLTLDGQPLYGDQPIDLFDPTVQPAPPISLGTLPLTPGVKQLKLTLIGKARASTGMVVGLDELRLIPVK